MLYSDIDDLDSAYKKITGATKAEIDEALRQARIEYEREKREHDAAIPRLTFEWIERGKAILDEKYHDIWVKIVPFRLRDMYRGMELGACLDIVDKLNKGWCLDEIKKIIEGQGHSGMSFGLVCAMVSELCDRGEVFAKYVLPQRTTS